MMSGRIALSVTAVSISVSPFFTLELPTAMFITSAPRRFPAISKDELGAVEASKKQVDLRAAAQRRALLLDLPGNADRFLGKIEQRLDFGPRQAFDAEQVAAGEAGRRIGSGH